MSQHEIAVIVGVGAGLGEALVRRLAAAGMTVVAVSRSGRNPAAPTAEEQGRILPLACDARESQGVATIFAGIERELGVPSLVVFNIGTFDQGSILDLSEETLVAAWKTGCLAGFLVGQAAARAMLPHGRGTIIFSGATASLRGAARFAAFAVPKFGLRALAQSMARELGPRGLHVAHVVLDGMIGADEETGSEGDFAPSAIAEAYLDLHRQVRSAWTHELDLRPMSERF